MIPNYEEIEAAYKELVASGNEPDLICVLVQKSKPKAVRRKIGRYIKQGFTSRGKVAFIVTKRNIGFYKV